MEVSFIKGNEHEKSNEFFNKIYNTNRSIKQWRWEFSTLCKENIPFVVTKENDDIIGTQAFIPVKLINEEGVFLSAKSEETLLHQSARGKGLFKSMYDLLFNYANEKDIHVIWGFTAAAKAFEKVNFEVPGKTSQLFMPLSSKCSSVLSEHLNSRGKMMILRGGLYGARLLSKLRFFTHRSKYEKLGIQIKVANNPPAEAGKICEDFIKQWRGVTIYRDFNYLQWRIYDNPYIKPTLKTVYIDSKLAGWIVYSIGHDYIGYILDIIVASPDVERKKLEAAVRALIYDAVLSIRKTGALGIRGWSINNHPFNLIVTEAAKSLGFYLIKKGEPIVMHFPKREDNRKYHSIKDLDNWYITRIFTEGVNG